MDRNISIEIENKNILIDISDNNLIIDVEKKVFVTVDGGRGPKGNDGVSELQPLRYKAILSQSGTNNPIPIVLENTISSDLEWEYLNINFYKLKSLSFPNGLFTLGKTFLYVGVSFESHNFRLRHSSNTGIANTSDINLSCTNGSAITGFTYLSVLIEIYP